MTKTGEREITKKENVNGGAGYAISAKVKELLG